MIDDIATNNNAIPSTTEGFGRGLFVCTASNTDPKSISTNDPNPSKTSSNTTATISKNFKDYPFPKSGLDNPLASVESYISQFTLQNSQPNINPQLSKSSLHRTESLSKFFEEGDLAIKASMRAQLDRMVISVQLAFPDRAALFKKEMDGYFELFMRYLAQRAREPLIWNKVQNLDASKIIPYHHIESSRVGTISDYNRLAVLKLNGGLGTTMGCIGPKSAIEVRDNLSFLDLTVRQIEYLNTNHGGIDVPLILMNSFNTDSKTRTILQKYRRHKVSIVTFNQSKYPRIDAESLMPVTIESSHSVKVELGRYERASSPLDTTKDPEIDDHAAWYPPGHGDLYSSLDQSGLLNDLLDNGKDILFISNIDNLGATVDPNILDYMLHGNCDFVMEVTDKTKNDIKGGTLIQYDGNIKLLEIAQVPPEHIKDFTSIKKFKVFNTNNIWINLKAVRQLLDRKALHLEVIENIKRMEGTDQKVIQLETAVGSAIEHFQNAVGINVPRSRFLPVKNTSDLFLIQSDLYTVSHGQLIMSPLTLTKRPYNTIPVVKLGDHFKKVKAYLERVGKGVPSLAECDHLTVSGDVTFGSDGTVIIVANHGSHIDIPSGSVLNDKVVSGTLHILDH